MTTETVENTMEDHEEEEEPSLIIPITSGSQKDLFIEIFPEEMSEIAASTLLSVLQDESAPMAVWADTALQYIRSNQARDASTILQAACSQTISDEKDKVYIHAAAGIAHLAVPTQRGSSSTRDDLRQLADTQFTNAAKVNTLFPMTWMGRGMLNLSVGRLDQARFFFDTTLKQCGPILPALLGMAAVLFGEKDYKGAQDMYGKALRLYPRQSGAPCRVGFGLASYRLGQVDRAKAAFARALELDPETVPAMVGAAILDLASLDYNEGETTEKAIKMMSMAHLLDNSNAMLQNHLANHYFWKWSALTGVVSVKTNSNVVTTTALAVDPGDRIRIGTDFESVVLEEDEEHEHQFRMKDVWKGPSADGLKVWKKDFDRVEALAKGAYNSTTVKEIQAESLFMLGRVHHVREQLENAHKFYEQACKLAPELTPARFGLAQTLMAEHKYQEAIAHLQLVLGTSSTAANAMAALGLLQVKTQTKNPKEGLTHLRRAIDLDPLNPDLIVLEAVALQEHDSNYPKALEKYKKAVELMERQGTKIAYEIYTNIGVLCHETRGYEEALEMYRKALVVLDEDGSAQEATLDNVGKEGGLIRHEENAIFFGYCDTKLTVEAPTTESNEIKIRGRFAETPLLVGDHVRLGPVFSTKITQLTSSGDGDDKEWTIHLDNPYCRDVEKENEEGKTDETPADGAIVSVFVKRENRRLENPPAISIAFNLARLHEVVGRTLAAIELHKAILKRNPAYVNSCLRLACIAIDCGSLKECSEWLKIAAAVAPGNPEVLTLVGNLHLSLCDWAPAQGVFDQLINNKVPKVEAYAMLSLGNIYFENMKVSPKRYLKSLQYATDYYRRILTRDPTNAYAANGIGTVLAEKAEIFKAKEVFNRVREVSGDSIPDAHLNLGHIFLAQKKHPEALQMYQSYLKRTEDGSAPITSKSRDNDAADVLLYIAFAYFDWARQTELLNNEKAAPADGRYKKAMEHLELALTKKSKKQVVLRYNLCMTKLQAANCVLQKLQRNIRRTAKEVEDALNDLEESHKQVTEILEAKTRGEKVQISSSTLSDFLVHCKSNIEHAKEHLNGEREREREAHEMRELQRLAAEAQRKEQALRAQFEEQEAAKKQEELDRKAAEKMRKVESLRAGWQKEQDDKKAAAGKKAAVAQAPGVEDDDDDDLFNEAPAPVAKSTNLFASSDEDSDDEDVNSAAKTEEKNGDNEEAVSSTAEKVEPTQQELFGDSSEDEANEEKNEGKASSEPQKTSHLFGDSSDEESDEELVPSAGTKRSSENMSGDAEEQPSKKRREEEKDEQKDSESFFQ